MRRLLAFTFLLAFCGAGTAQAADPSCVLENCTKTDISKEAAKAMKESPGGNIASTPPQEIIRAIQKEIAAEPKRASSSESAPRRASNNDPYNQPPTCDYYADSKKAFLNELIEYSTFLQQEQIRIRADTIAYGQRLREEDAALKAKAAEFQVVLKEGQRQQSIAHVEYQAQMNAEKASFEAKAAEYHEELVVSQKAMCCPKDEAYTDFLGGGYSTKWKY